MPYIDVKLSCGLSNEKEELLKAAFGRLIADIPGKTEDYFMVKFEDNCRLWFRGKNSNPIAFVNVMLYGKAEASAYQKLSEDILALLKNEMNVQPTNAYVKFEEVPNWFWG